ncbi:hypothetical protein MYSTI_04018 [Myxococcus stipitatus DSM 14675]|uniref:Lipoprotein n=1 Tax=Myxococcus stipitatus (strain DSM 14675 / JCM 12634 / Mx s8) TaxID=1278073 RepID=L7UFT7_MYXSD|nr:hypothetical protein [Myxococcus stipitatus]AGC45319.1 hypothetical protein MYSTI_04018 [Myxococcus stipitatus DSM 14675]
MRPFRLIATLMLLTMLGCDNSSSDDDTPDAGPPDSGVNTGPPDSGVNTTPASSFAACSFEQECTTRGERCYVSQECPIATPDAGPCAPETGDRLCHRHCSIPDAPCAPGEKCIEVSISPRADYGWLYSLCFK